jgi:mannan endo-1,4-beta-mannosidase
MSHSRHIFRLIWPLVLGGACTGPSLEVLIAEEPVSSDFLSARQDQLWWRGEPYRFVSLNAFTLSGCGKEGELFDAARRDAFFASLRPHSLVRTYAFHSQALADIEAVVAAAERHEHLLELVLADGNGSCSDDGARKGEAWYHEDFRDDYLPWVRELTAHFRDRPSVGLWELVSSPTDVAPATLRAFYDEVGSVVHELAPHQLVASGTHGAWAYGGSESYALIHASAGVDVAEFRDYEQEPGAPPNLAEALTALAGSKPLILAEAGVFASPTGDAAQELEGRVCISWAERRDVLASWFESARTTPLAGVLVWNYLPVAQGTCSYSTHESDPLFQAIHDAPL